VTAALVVLLGLSVPLRAPDLQVEAVTAAGVDLPELADAVARALVASGARVVLRGPSSGPCLYCAKVVVVEAGQGSCRVEVKQDVKQDRHFATARLQFPAGSQLFDRARAIAIQARVLVTWETSPESNDAVARPATRKPERRGLEGNSDPGPRVASAASVSIKESAPVTGPQPESVPARRLDPVGVPERRANAALVAPVTYADRLGAKPTDRTGPEKSDIVRARPRRDLAAEVAAVSLEPTPSRWPWIPTMVGTGAAIAAGVCAAVARDRYNTLADRSQPFQSAQAVKSEGQKWQVASFVLSGVAVAGLTTGLIGFATQSSDRQSERSSVALVAAPVQGGGMVAVSGVWP
jgi:hypothetical protein